MFHAQSSVYICKDCGKIYKVRGRFSTHLKNHHPSWMNFSDMQKSTQTTSDVLRCNFVKCALLLMDTHDAYRMGDGDSIFRNAKLELLLCDVTGHFKYKLWLWRMLAYELAVLSHRQAFEYKWNTVSNLQGGNGQNIPNDNLVELIVHRIKHLLRAQGANATFSSVALATKALQVVDRIKENMKKQCSQRNKGKSRAIPNKSTDIKTMIDELFNSSLFGKDTSLRSFHGFVDLYKKVNIPNLHKWINAQRKSLL